MTVLLWFSRAAHCRCRCPMDIRHPAVRQRLGLFQHLPDWCRSQRSWRRCRLREQEAVPADSATVVRAKCATTELVDAVLKVLSSMVLPPVKERRFSDGVFPGPPQIAVQRTAHDRQVRRVW